MENFFELNSLEDFYSQNPDSIIFSFLAHEYIKSGNYEKALEVAEKGIRKYPNYAYGYYVLGLAHYHLNDLNKAKKFLELSVSHDEKNPQAWKLISEISENLGQSATAVDSNLQYFLLDAFNKDAVEKFQREDMLQFDEFENDQNLEFENELTGDETQPEEEDFRLPQDEADIEELFESKGEEPEELDITKKVNEVFKETLGEMSIEREEKPVDETLFDDAFENLDLEEKESKKQIDESPFDEAFERFDFEEEEKETTQPEEFLFDEEFEKSDVEEEIEEKTIFPKKNEADLTDDFNFNADFDDFYTEPGIDEEAADEGETELIEEEKAENETDEDEDFDFNSILFDEAKVKEEKMPPLQTDEEERAEGTTGVEETEESDKEELLNYRSMVDDILSEKEEELDMETKEIGEEMPATSAEQPDIPEDEEASAQPPVAARPVSPPPIASRTDGTTRFVKPPILSPTLGEIYISQGRFEEALDVFKQLLSKDPENQRYQKKITDIQSMLDRQESL
jgi:tetratricopeptide (TPR) repeat protein